MGVWGEHRNVIHFTGDARPKWEMLDFQTLMSAAEAGIGMPYVSHDIGGFGAITSDGTAGRHLADDLYVRWVQSGAFQPILRLHSDHGDRLPWDYGGKAEQVSARFLRLRAELIPYLYTLARRALTAARRSCGRCTSAGRATAMRTRTATSTCSAPTCWWRPWGRLATPPPRRSGSRPAAGPTSSPAGATKGPAVRRLSVPLERMPVFARSGAVLTRQEYSAQGNRRARGRLIVEAYPGRKGAFTLYEDQGRRARLPARPPRPDPHLTAESPPRR